ncbi:family 10 glycosylhydrolase [Leptolyngbya sp. CCNP1308]|uniref:glycoside hydrolase family 10 protein n=1 Tax=Leptolyngbya sp. CCNP1308 TaxID=3110255 RepID=UPI002B21C347|nr:family 10 glycosylhydrolase [Leptolyngbya sp. CCNP1308]MEA5450163.1 family 10 glycosylhydrolase [Leptolyngbya sp. CCNP1308]
MTQQSGKGLLLVAIAGLVGGTGLPIRPVTAQVESQPSGLEQPASAAALTDDLELYLDLTDDSEAESFPLVPTAEPSSPTRPGRRPAYVPPSPPLPPSQRPRVVQPANSGNAAVDSPSPTSGDPAEQIAPAVIELSPTGRPPSPVVFLAMQQELKNLIGRFESALIMANSLDAPTALTLPDRPPVLTAAADSVNVASGRGAYLHPTLGEAQQLLNEWDGLLAAGKHGEVRDRWLATRAALWENFPTDRPINQGEIRAVWLDRGTIVRARSPQGLSAIFDKLAAAGINTVFFETVNAGYPIYPSRVAPEQNPLTQGWDPLAAAVELAHQRGMTLHAWVWVFAAGNQRHNRLLNQPADYPGPIISRHPSWAAYDNSGNLIPRGQDKPFLDPANPEVRSYLTRLMTEIVTDYGVDGLHLDYIRYPFQDPGANRTYGYGEVARWRFQSVAGVDPVTLNPRASGLDRNQQIQQQVLWERWTEFRVQQVTSFVETISSTLRRQHPGLVMSAAVFANPEHERLQRIQQDWGAWARADYLDWIVLMSYAGDTSRFERIVSPWLVNESFGSTLVIPGIRLLDLSNAATIDQMQASRDLPTPGYALFAVADLNTELNTVLAQTQSGSPPGPTTPYAMAASRYAALQREWSWLLTHQRLWMDRNALEPWIGEVNDLGSQFDNLAQEPSHRHLENVRAGLARVRTPLNQGVLVDTTNSGYRLRSWQHRLTAIEQLLEHGERSQP